MGLWQLGEWGSPPAGAEWVSPSNQGPPGRGEREREREGGRERGREGRTDGRTDGRTNRQTDR